MEFRELLAQAKQGNPDALSEIIVSYQPLLRKMSMVNSRFDEDMYQELSLVLLKCIQKYDL